MKKLLIVGNWKSNVTKIEAKKWIEEFDVGKFPENIEVVLLPPFTLIDIVNNYVIVNDLPLSLGVQNVSQFEKGPYTGEISAEQVKELADFVLIGHSERRTNFNETDEIVNKKIEQALKQGLRPIVCISNLDQVKNLTNGEFVIAYEPIEAIGTGKPEDSSSVSLFAKQIKEIIDCQVLYGGSINADNLKEYTELAQIDGVLVGGQSLSAASFLNIIKNAV